MATVQLENQAVEVNNIFCIGRNYVAHIEELKNETPTEPVVFMKPNGSLLHSGGEIVRPEFSQSLHYECEMVLLIGQDSDGLEENLLGLIEGFGVGLDLTARDVQSRLKEKGLPWMKAKGFRGAACVSDFVCADKIANPLQTEFTFHIDGELRQHGHTNHMIYDLNAILRELASTYGLRQGDVVYTGTPAGVGELLSGQKLRLDLAGVVQAEFGVA